MTRAATSKLSYRLDLLPTIGIGHWRARMKRTLRLGELVYYGPYPPYYGIGEVKYIEGPFVAVDFRGTGTLSVHEDIIEQRYLFPIPEPAWQLL